MFVLKFSCTPKNVDMIILLRSLQLDDWNIQIGKLYYCDFLKFQVNLFWFGWKIEAWFESVRWEVCYVVTDGSFFPQDQQKQKRWIIIW